MTTRRAAITSSCLIAVCVAALAACSSGGDGSAGSSTPSVASTTPTTATSTTATSTTATPTTATPTSSTSTPVDPASALLTAAEVGTGYTLASSQSDGDSALPCTPSAPPLFTQAPPSGKGNHNYQNAGDSVEISEVLAVYGDAAGSRRAFTTGSAGFSCSSGSLNGTKVTIGSRRQGAPAGSGIDDLGAWDFAANGVKGTAILLRVGSKLIGLTFVATPAAAGAVPVGDITERAADKVLKAG